MEDDHVCPTESVPTPSFLSYERAVIGKHLLRQNCVLLQQLMSRCPRMDACRSFSQVVASRTGAIRRASRDRLGLVREYKGKSRAPVGWKKNPQKSHQLWEEWEKTPPALGQA